MDEQKHTALPWMAATAYSSVCGVPIVNQEGRRVANTALPDMPKDWDELKRQAVIDAAFICRAVNTYPAVADLVDALECADEWLSGWASADPYLAHIRSALTRFRSLEASTSTASKVKDTQ